MLSVWYKESPGSTWQKYMDSWDLHEVLATIKSLRLALGDDAVVKYF